ncbi:MAG TPA: cytochrome P450 [Dehalococcoidia bacterium]|nr:cytochrome P450 [Dehalococcoidia bacterium]
MAEFNPFDPRLRSNPYAVYKELRDEAPVHWSEVMQLWVLTRYDDVLAVLRDHGRFSSERTRATNRFVKALEEYRNASGPIGRTPTMLSIDPPAHTRMRNLVNQAFTPRVVERIRPHIGEIADELIDALPEPGRIDVVKDLAETLPVIVIAEVLGIPKEDRLRFKGWSNDIAGTLGGPFQPADVLERAQRSANELADYFREQIEMRRGAPRDDLLSAMIAAEEQGDLLSEDEMLATCILLLVAGNETTTNLIGNGMLALLEHPDQLRLLQEDPSLMPAAVDEMLRYDGPAQMTSRIVVEDMEFEGQKMAAGQVVLAILGAANHDPAQFENADSFDIKRFANRNLAFGYGIHYCLGAPLALAEAQVAIETLLRRFPEPHAAFETPEWGASFILRGLKSLKLESKVPSQP